MLYSWIWFLLDHQDNMVIPFALWILHARFSFISFPNADAATELQVSNSRLTQVEAALAAQKSEVKPFTLKEQLWITRNLFAF